MAVRNKVSKNRVWQNGTVKSGTMDTSYATNINDIPNPTISSSSQNNKIAPVDMSYQGNTSVWGVNGQSNQVGTTSSKQKQQSSHIQTSGNQPDLLAMDYAANGVNGGVAPESGNGVKFVLNSASFTGGEGTDGTSNTETDGGTGGNSTPSTDNGGTVSTGETGDSAAGGGEVDTYEEFLLKQEGYYKEQLDKLNALIEQNKQNTLQQAESERERAVIDARSSSEQNKATYGANAEQLAAMGLSGSGYGDYLNQQAYATQRAETQNANSQAEATKIAAEQQANSDKLNAELSYSENMLNNSEKLAQYQQQKAEEAKAEEEMKKQYYAALLTSANTGEFTSEQLASLGAQYGLDEAQISQLQAAADKYKRDWLSDFYRAESNNILSHGSDYQVSYLDKLLSNGDIDRKTYDDLMKQYASIVAEESNTEQLENLHNEGKIDDSTYHTQVDKWNKDIDVSSFFNEVDYTAGKQAYEEVLNNPWATEDTKAKLKASYTRAYAEDIARELVGNSVSGGVTVDINSSSYNAKQWGDYNDIEEPNSGQGQLISRFVEDAKLGKIKEGQVITVNYGQVWSDYGVFVYIGDGVFVKCDNSARNKYEKYTPSGYKYGGINGSIRK